MMLLLWMTFIIQLFQCNGKESSSCTFNSLCTCSSEQHHPGTQSFHTVTCLSVPFYKFPNFQEGSISQLELTGSRIVSLEAESLANISCQVQALILSNNRVQHVAERALSSIWKSLNSLDLSYNQLDSIPFAALKVLQNLQWINLHGNQISTLSGDWSHLKNSIATLFLGENDITTIQTNTEKHTTLQGLHSFRNLIWINLDGNRIYKIEKHSLPVSLQTASISHNLIETFPLDIIASLPHLQWLYLRGNHIKTFPEHTFTRKLWLEKIDLGENYLNQLPKNAFNDTVLIRDFNLAFNNFKIITANSFQGLQCARIILSYNLLEELEPLSFSGIETSLEYLDLDHNNFLEIPMAIMKLQSLKYLYLSSNSLNVIPDGAFDNFCTSLKALSLNGNHLSQIPTHVLKNCSKISHFNIGFNEIKELVADDFAEWGNNIERLILESNRITNLRSNIFNKLRSLKELSLSFNPLRVLDKNAFVGLDNLESLEISFGIEYENLPYDIFKPLQNLKWLSIDNNNFNTLSANAFDTLQELKYLNMESNNFLSLPVGLFKPTIHTKLSDLRLGLNKLTTMVPFSFMALLNLETLALSDNFLITLQTNSFYNLPNLRRLILSNNRLNKIETSAFTGLSSLNNLDLQNNYLTELSFDIFKNTSSIFNLNLSRNFVNICNSDHSYISLESLDLSFNNLGEIPKCFENILTVNNLYLDNNKISTINHSVFSRFNNLIQLSLHKNIIFILNKSAFNGLNNLQQLDLSFNQINQLHYSQFVNMSNLRILNLSHNFLNNLPKDIFENTLIEMLDLSKNRLSVVPSLSLSTVGLSLRKLIIRHNNIEHIDSTTFPEIPNLLHLDLSQNKLTILPDNVFTNLGLLQSLDLSSNPLRANFKELFHYAQNLKHLNLADSGITETPHFPLPNLVRLNLSSNQLETINKNSLAELTKLKLLDLSTNKLKHVPSHLWTHFKSLKSLDLSNNPIKEIISDSFIGLNKLQELNIRYLNQLRKFEESAVSQIRILSTLHMQTWPSIVNFSQKFCILLSNLRQLRILKVFFLEHTLNDQLHCINNKKLRYVEISGSNLKHVEKTAFSKLNQNPDLVLKIIGTQVEELPAGVFSNMYKIAFLTIDLSGNMLTNLSPEIFYGNYTTWKNVGTSLVSGGLIISNNPFKCGCHLAWLGHWLRRWTRESLQSHNAPVETAIKVNELIKEAMCTESGSGLRIPIIQLPYEDISCQASALSLAPKSPQISVVITYIMYWNTLGVFAGCDCTGTFKQLIVLNEVHHIITVSFRPYETAYIDALNTLLFMHYSSFAT